MERLADGREVQTLVQQSPEHPRNGEADIVALKNGDLLLGYGRWEADGSDFGRAEIWGKVSHDGGRTWGEDRVLVPNEGKLTTFEVGFLRLRSGDLLISYCSKDSTEQCAVNFRRSRDEGKTWGDHFRYAIPRPYSGYTGINNDRLLQLRSGRILLPVYDGSVHGTPLVCLVLYSDDDGRTWRHSSQVSVRDLSADDKWGVGEPPVVELKDGRVMMTVRTNLGIMGQAYSTDGGATWGKLRPIKGLVSPCSPHSIARLPQTGDLLLVWNNTTDKRDPLNTAISRDEGETWEHIRVLDRGGLLCYTSITPLGDRVLLAYYAPPDLSLRLQSVPVRWFYGLR